MGKAGIRKGMKYGDSCRILFLFCVVFLLGSIAILLPNLKMLTEIGIEDIYWERARFLAGQGGASRYDGNALQSIGYSLVLLPVCILIKSPYAAYKAAILLNCCFLCGSFYVSFITVCKWFPKENKRPLLLFCFLVALCPIFAVGRILTCPVMVELFLIWLVLYLLTVLWESEARWKIAALAVCLSLLVFFNIALIGVVGAVLITLLFFTKQKKLDMNSCLLVVLVVLLGLIAGNMIERVVSYFFFKSQDTVPNSSLTVLFNCIEAGWEKGQLVELIRGIIGKLFGAALGSFLLFFPGMWFAVRRGYKRSTVAQTDVLSVVSRGICLMLLFQLVIGSLCDNSGNKGTLWVSLRNIDVVLPAFLLLGLMDIKSRKLGVRELAVFLLLFCVSAYITANVFQTNGITGLSKVYSSALTIFHNGQMQAVSQVYFAACMTILAGILLIGCWQVDTQHVWLRKLLKMGAGFVLVVIYCVSGLKICRETAISTNQKLVENVASIASLLSETDEALFYLKGTGNDSYIVALQSLVPDQEIHLIENSDLERDVFYEEIVEQEKDAILISGTGKTICEEITEKLPEYQLLYTTGYYALWADRNGASFSVLEAGVSRRLEIPELNTDTEEELGYGCRGPLPVGTYRMELYLKRTEKMDQPSKQNGTLTVSDSMGKIQTVSFDGTVFDENGKGAVVVEFTGKNVMQNVTFKMKGNILPYIEVERLHYWQTAPEYTIGQNQIGGLVQVCQWIEEFDDASGTHGSVVYVEDAVEETVRTSTSCLEEYLPDRDVTVISSVEAERAEADYLVATTEEHAYYQAMDAYSVIYRDSQYTVLVKLGTQQYQMAKEMGRLQSEGTRLLMSAFEKTNKDYREQVTLERGTYRYHFQAVCDQIALPEDTETAIGALRLYNGTTLLTEKTVYSGEVKNGEVAVPFSLNAKAKKLRYEVEIDGGAEVEFVQDSIEIVSRKFQFGSDAPSFTELTDMANLFGGHTRMLVLQSEKMIQREMCEYTYLQDLLQECEIEICTISEVNGSLEDELLLTYDLTAEHFNLLDRYSILGHAGKYTLMVRNNGALLAESVELGLEVKNSGRKLTPESIASMSGVEGEANVVGKLPKAKYCVTLRLEAEELEMDDTVEVTLVCDKSSAEVEEEIEALVDGGYTEEQAQREVELQMESGSASIDAYKLSQNGSILVSVTTNAKRALENLTVEAYTWHGAKVKGKIVWIELV